MSLAMRKRWKRSVSTKVNRKKDDLSGRTTRGSEGWSFLEGEICFVIPPLALLMYRSCDSNENSKWRAGSREQLWQIKESLYCASLAAIARKKYQRKITQYVGRYCPLKHHSSLKADTDYTTFLVFRDLSCQTRLRKSFPVLADRLETLRTQLILVSDHMHDIICTHHDASSSGSSEEADPRVSVMATAALAAFSLVKKNKRS